MTTSYTRITSFILLENNGWGSSGQRTQHMNVRYFFIADCVKSGEIRIAYCPTGIMVADYFTKALQGVIFCQLHDMIMGNINIELPPGPDKMNVIPDVLTQQESRSVLKNEIEKGRLPCSLAVLPVYGKANDITTRNARNLVVSKRTLSWADVARGQKRG